MSSWITTDCLIMQWIGNSILSNLWVDIEYANSSKELGDNMGEKDLTNVMLLYCFKFKGNLTMLL